MANNYGSNTVTGAESGLSIVLNSARFSYCILSQNMGSNKVINLADSEAANAIDVTSLTSGVGIYVRDGGENYVSAEVDKTATFKIVSNTKAYGIRAQIGQNYINFDSTESGSVILDINGVRESYGVYSEVYESDVYENREAIKDTVNNVNNLEAINVKANNSVAYGVYASGYLKIDQSEITARNKINGVKQITVASDSGYANGIVARYGSINKVIGNTESGMTITVNSSAEARGIRARDDENSYNNVQNIADVVGDNGTVYAIGVTVKQDTPLIDEDTQEAINTYARGIESYTGSNKVTALQDTEGNYKAASINISMEGLGATLVDAIGINSRTAASSNVVTGISDITAYAKNIDNSQSAYSYGINSSYGTNTVTGANAAMIKTTAEGGSYNRAVGINAISEDNTTSATNTVSGFSSISATAYDAYGILAQGAVASNTLDMVSDANNSVVIKATTNSGDSGAAYGVFASAGGQNTITNTDGKLTISAGFTNDTANVGAYGVYAGTVSEEADTAVSKNTINFKDLDITAKAGTNATSIGVWAAEKGAVELNGTGALTITAGKALKADGDGTISVSSNTATLNGNVEVAENATLTNAQGTMSITGDFANAGTVTNKGTMNVTGKISGSGSLSNEGSMSLIGSSANAYTGTITNEGTMTNATGSIIAGDVINSEKATLTAAIGDLSTGEGKSFTNSGTFNLVGDLTKDVQGAGTTVLQNDITVTGDAGKTIAGTLNMNDKTIDMQDPSTEITASTFKTDGKYNTLNVGKLIGNGTLKIDADASNGNVDSINVTGTADNDATINVTSILVRNPGTDATDGYKKDGYAFLTGNNINGVSLAVSDNAAVSASEDYDFTFTAGTDGTLSVLREESVKTVGQFITGTKPSVTGTGTSYVMATTFAMTKDGTLDGQVTTASNERRTSKDLTLGINRGVTLSGVADANAGITVADGFTLDVKGQAGDGTAAGSAITNMGTAVTNNGTISLSDINFNNNTKDIVNNSKLTVSGTNTFAAGIENNGTAELDGTNNIASVAGTGTMSTVGGTTTINGTTVQNAINVNKTGKLVLNNSVTANSITVAENSVMEQNGGSFVVNGDVTNSGSMTLNNLTGTEEGYDYTDVEKAKNKVTGTLKNSGTLTLNNTYLTVNKLEGTDVVVGENSKLYTKAVEVKNLDVEEGSETKVEDLTVQEDLKIGADAKTEVTNDLVVNKELTLNTGSTATIGNDLKVEDDLTIGEGAKAEVGNDLVANSTVNVNSNAEVVVNNNLTVKEELNISEGASASIGNDLTVSSDLNVRDGASASIGNNLTVSSDLKIGDGAKAEIGGNAEIKGTLSISDNANVVVAGTPKIETLEGKTQETSKMTLSTDGLLSEGAKISQVSNITLNVEPKADTPVSQAAASNDNVFANLNSAQSSIANIKDSKINISEGRIIGDAQIIYDSEGKASVVETPNKTNTGMVDSMSNAANFGRTEMNDIRKRMGDVRMADGQNGIWVRTENGRFEGNGSANNFHKNQIGTDKALSSKWRLGGAFSYTLGTTSFGQGRMESDTSSLAGYGLYTGSHGEYADIIARVGMDKNKMSGVASGSMTTPSYALSAEIGKTYELKNNFFVEPQVEFMYSHSSGDSFEDSGTTYKLSGMNSFNGRLGFALGYKSPDKRGTIYTRLGVLHEFAGDRDMDVYNSSISRHFANSNHATWYEWAVGGQYSTSKCTYLYVDLEKTFRAQMNEKYRMNVGFRYSF